MCFKKSVLMSSNHQNVFPSCYIRVVMYLRLTWSVLLGTALQSSVEGHQHATCLIGNVEVSFNAISLLFTVITIVATRRGKCGIAVEAEFLKSCDCEQVGRDLGREAAVLLAPWPPSVVS